MNQIDQGVAEFLLSKGPIIGPLLVLAYYLFKRADKANERLITQLKDEIERITKSRNRLERNLLNNRVSSSGSDLEEDDE